MLATVLLLAVLRALVVQVYGISSQSMEPSLRPGDRVLVSRWGDPAVDVRRGDVVVFDGTGLFTSPQPPDAPLRAATGRVSGWLGLGGREREFVKRVVGLPGDRVACCDAAGAVTVDGSALPEPYLHPGDVPSEATFDVLVPPGKVWLMGDHRSRSSDSRDRLGTPGGGMVPWDRVRGPVVALAWPPDRIGTFVRPGRSGTLEDGTGTG